MPKASEADSWKGVEIDFTLADIDVVKMKFNEYGVAFAFGASGQQVATVVLPHHAIPPLLEGKMVLFTDGQGLSDGGSVKTIMENDLISGMLISRTEDGPFTHAYFSMDVGTFLKQSLDNLMQRTAEPPRADA